MCFPAAKEHQGTAEPRRHWDSHSKVCEWSQQRNHSAEEREDVPDHISSEKEERQPEVMGQKKIWFKEFSW